MMKILTWNINGIRAVTGKSGVTVGRLLNTLDADVVCLQETKVTRDMLDEPTAIVDGYEAYFSFSRKRTGYSGTVNYCKKGSAPTNAEEGLTGRLNSDQETCVGCYRNMSGFSEKDLDALDAEGRCVITQHKIKLQCGSERAVAIINVYVPRAGDRPDRLTYKLKFLTLLRFRAEALLRKGIHVIILGDLNLTHRELDNCDPKSDADFLRRSSRVWINNILQESERDPGIARSHPDLVELAVGTDSDSDSSDNEVDQSEETDSQLVSDSDKRKKTVKISDRNLLFSDSYRRLHPNESAGYTNWDTSNNARESNYGRRLDYILVDTDLAGHVTDCLILTEVEGSDHCPVVVTLDCQPVASSAASPPLLCSKLMPEFRGQQQKLSMFFSKAVKNKKAEDVVVVSPSSSQEKIEPITESSVSSQDIDEPSASKEFFPMQKSKSVSLSSSSLPGKKTGIKRSLTSTSSFGPSKQAKKQSKLGSKQASLVSFFAPKAGTTTNKSNVQSVQTSSNNIDSSHANLDADDDIICIDNTVPTHSDNSVAGKGSGETNIKKSDSFKESHIKSDDKSKSIQTVKPSNAASQAQSWKSLLSGPAPSPLCPGHKEPCVLKTVRKSGPNRNKQFYSCARPDGPAGNTQYRCNFFQWLHDRQKKKS